MLSFGCDFFFFFHDRCLSWEKLLCSCFEAYFENLWKSEAEKWQQPADRSVTAIGWFSPRGFFKAPDSYIIGCTSKYTKKLQSYQWWADNFVFNPWPKIGTHVIQSETFFTWCLSKLFLRHLFAWSRFMTTSFPISSLSLILIDTVITLFVTKLSHQGIKNPKYNK